MAYIIKKYDGWVVRWREGGRKGKHCTSQVFASHTEAKAFSIKLEGKQLAGKDGNVSGPTYSLPILIELHMTQRPKRAKTPEIRERYDRLTRAAYANILKKYPKWKMPIDIQRNEYANLQFGERRFIKTLLLLARSYGQPIVPGILAMRIERARKTPQDILLSKELVTEIQSQADSWCPGLGLAVHLLSTYGHRPQSIVALNQSSFNHKTKILTIDIKSGDIHSHPVTTATAERIAAARTYLQSVLEREILPSDPLIPSHFETPGRRYQNGSALASWYRQCIGEKLHPESTGIYNLKRYAISNLIQTGQDPKTIASITGHRTTSLILNTYARTNQDAQKRAIAAIENLE